MPAISSLSAALTAFLDKTKQRFRDKTEPETITNVEVADSLDEAATLADNAITLAGAAGTLAQQAKTTADNAMSALASRPAAVAGVFPESVLPPISSASKTNLLNEFILALDNRYAQLGSTPPSNAAPTVINVAITNASSAKEGVMLTGYGLYQDAENNPEGASLFQWWRANGTDKSGAVQITGAASLNYTPVTADVGKSLFFRYYPVASTGTLVGTMGESAATPLVLAADVVTPPTGGYTDVNWYLTPLSTYTSGTKTLQRSSGGYNTDAGGISSFKNGTSTNDNKIGVKFILGAANEEGFIYLTNASTATLSTPGSQCTVGVNFNGLSARPIGAVFQGTYPNFASYPEGTEGYVYITKDGALVVTMGTDEVYRSANNAAPGDGYHVGCTLYTFAARVVNVRELVSNPVATGI